MPSRRSSKNTDHDFLAQLERDSWNLELIISGLALIGLAAAGDYVDEKFDHISHWKEELLPAAFLLISIISAGYLIFINLVVHFLLRSLWVAGLGLRSVSGEVNFLRLKMAPRFDRFLRRRIGSFDQYLERLDKLCSVLFAFSFLIAMIVISFFIWMALLMLLAGVVGRQVDTTLSRVTFIISLLSYLLGTLLYLIDFISLGRIKKIKWFSVVYYPVYRFFGWITLARFYRPIYYNFIDTAYTRKILWAIPPYLLLLFFISGIQINAFATYDYMDFNAGNQKNGRVANLEHYTDHRQTLNDPVAVPIEIPSDYIRERVLRVKFPILPSYNEIVWHNCPDFSLAPQQLVSHDFIEGMRGSINDVDLPAKQLDTMRTCITQAIELTIDEVPVSLEESIFLFADDAHFATLQTYVPLDSLSRGLHQIHFKNYEYRPRSDTVRVAKEYVLPFYYDPR
ncbi:MAG: hypothetical protein AAF828_05570 [Bacteroidota bacterium]